VAGELAHAPPQGLLQPCNEELRRDIDTVAQLLEALPAPVWARDGHGRLTWVNAAYARAVEARNGTDAVARSLEILDPGARDGAEGRNDRAYFANR